MSHPWQPYGRRGRRRHPEAGEGPQDRGRPGPKNTCSGLEQKELFIGAPVPPARRAHAAPGAASEPSVVKDKRPLCSRPSAGAGSPKHRTQPGVRCQPAGIQSWKRPWPRPCVASAHCPSSLCVPRWPQAAAPAHAPTPSCWPGAGRGQRQTGGQQGHGWRAGAISRLLPLLGQLLAGSESFPEASRHGTDHDEPQERSCCPHSNGRARAEGICRHKEL